MFGNVKLDKTKIMLYCNNYAPVAQLDRALVCGTKGQEFESLRVRQKRIHDE